MPAITAVILAAGIAQRLRPLTDHTPKCLLEAGGKAILGHMLDQLSKNGINNIIMVTGYREEMIQDYVKKFYPDLTVKFITNPVYDCTNNIYSLWLAEAELKEKPFLLLDSDIVFDHRIIKALLESEHDNCLAINSNYTLGEEEIKVVCTDNNRIRNISKIVDPATALGESIGIELFGSEGSKAIFAEIEQLIESEKGRNLFYEFAFELAIQNGMPLFAVDTSHYPSMEIDFKEDFEKAAQEVIPKIQQL